MRYEYVATKGTAPFTIGTTPFALYTVVIPHNLGYVPFYKMRYKYTGDDRYFDMFAGVDSYDIAGNDKQVYDIVADTTNITVTFTDGGGGTGATGNVYYRIYAEPKL